MDIESNRTGNCGMYLLLNDIRQFFILKEIIAKKSYVSLFILTIKKEEWQ